MKIFKAKRRIRAIYANLFLLEKKYTLFGITVTPWIVDWPEPLSGHDLAIKAMFYREAQDANR